jgi:exopolysaccharide biosynthesis predicted pyruvyltransferase EpsI
MRKEIFMKDIYFLDDNDTILKKAKKIFEKETGLKIEGFKSK